MLLWIYITLQLFFVSIIDNLGHFYGRDLHPLTDQKNREVALQVRAIEG